MESILPFVVDETAAEAVLSWAVPDLPGPVTAEQRRILAHFLGCLDEKPRCIVLSKAEGKSYEQVRRLTDSGTSHRVQQHCKEAKKKIELLLTADWLEQYRSDIGKGVAGPLPFAVQTLRYKEIMHMQNMSSEQKEAVLKSHKRTATAIARETGATEFSIRGLFKCIGSWPESPFGVGVIAAVKASQGNLRPVIASGIPRKEARHYAKKAGYSRVRRVR